MSNSQGDDFGPYAILNIAVYLKYEIFTESLFLARRSRFLARLKRLFVVARDNIVTSTLLNI